MDSVRRNAWLGLFAIGLLIAIFGVVDIASGAAADVGIPHGLTGKTTAELEAESPDAYRTFDFMVRVNGWSLVLIGGLVAVIVAIPFRRGEPWAWWAAWALPLWAAAVAIFYLVAGVQPDEPPPPPMISGPIIAVISAALLLLARPSAKPESAG
jgi:hypothetical protein